MIELIKEIIQRDNLASKSRNAPLRNKRMYLYNSQNLKNKEIFILVLLISASIIVRIPIILFFGDETLQNEWRILVSNLSTHGTLAFDYHQNELNKYLLPNIWMPPLYAYFLYFFSFFNLEDQN